MTIPTPGISARAPSPFRGTFRPPLWASSEGPIAKCASQVLDDALDASRITQGEKPNWLLCAAAYLLTYLILRRFTVESLTPFHTVVVWVTEDTASGLQRYSARLLLV